MRAAFRSLDLDSFVEHDVAFHRRILEASRNEVLLRVWDSLAVDLRIRGAIEKVARDLPEVVESHQPIVMLLRRGRGREAGLLLRNHVETLLEFLKKSESDSGFHRAFRNDLEEAKDIQKAFFPQGNLSIPGLSCETFYKPAHGIGGEFERVLVEKIENRVAPFDTAAAQQAGDLMAVRHKKGRPGELRDTMIAGIVLASHAKLATRNTSHFEDLSVPVVNPWSS